MTACKDRNGLMGSATALKSKLDLVLTRLIFSSLQEFLPLTTFLEPWYSGFVLLEYGLLHYVFFNYWNFFLACVAHASWIILLW